MRTPRQVDVEITARCNLRCRYCYFFDQPGPSYDDLPTGRWLAFMAELGRCRVMSVTLQGGEPFLRPDLPAIVDAVVANGMRFSVLSNGTCIAEEQATRMAASGRCNGVQVSLDGATAAVHDACRGEGSFAAALGGIETLRRHGLPVSVRVTIHRHNVDHLAETARFLLETLGLPGFSTNAAGYLGSCRLHTDQVLLDVRQRQAAMATLSRLADRYPGRIRATAGPLAEARQWAAMEDARRDKAPPFAEGGRLTGCGCVFSKIAVRADGHYVPCALMPQQALGRIGRDELARLWRNHPVLEAMRRRRRRALRSFAFCRDCPYIDYCTGNCPALAYALTGRVDHPSPDACLRRYLDGGGRLPAGAARTNPGTAPRDEA